MHDTFHELMWGRLLTVWGRGAVSRCGGGYSLYGGEGQGSEQLLWEEVPGRVLQLRGVAHHKDGWWAATHGVAPAQLPTGYLLYTSKCKNITSYRINLNSMKNTNMKNTNLKDWIQRNLSCNLDPYTVPPECISTSHINTKNYSLQSNDTQTFNIREKKYIRILGFLDKRMNNLKHY